MSLARLTARVPSAKRLGTYVLQNHQLCFHKIGKDGSAKCDAFYSNNSADIVIGALFDIEAQEKSALDQAEGLGHGYQEKQVTVTNGQGDKIQAFTYYALQIDASLLPFSWYLQHVIVGAQEINVPKAYFSAIKATPVILDPNTQRHGKQWSIHQ